MQLSQFFDEELNILIDRPTRYIEVWLAHSEPLVQQALAEAA
jgi:hypothetical protein